MDETEDDAIAIWKEEANKRIRQKEAEQAFVNSMIDCVYKICAPCAKSSV